MKKIIQIAVSVNGTTGNNSLAALTDDGRIWQKTREGWEEVPTNEFAHGDGKAVWFDKDRDDE